MSRGTQRSIAWLVLLIFFAHPNVPGAASFESRALESVVAVLPGGYLATALHVVQQATQITVRLRDGRALAARLVAQDAPTDLALLRIEADLPVLRLAPEPALGTPVCTIANQFGLGLSVTCGVVSATRRSAAAPRFR